MYILDNEVKDLFRQNYLQIINITFHGTETTLEITQDDIVQGSVNLDRASISGSKLELGSAIASQLTFKLKNDDGKYNDIKFEGAQLFVKIGIKKWDANRWEKAELHWIPIGYFIVDENPRHLNTIEVNALDRLIWLDKLVDWSRINFPTTVANLAEQVGGICGFSTFEGIPSTGTGATLKLTDSSFMGDDEEVTYRQIIQWCAALMNKCVYVDANGSLVFSWYSSDTSRAEVITSSDRYNSDIHENDIEFTGLYYTGEDDNTTLVGTKDYAIDVSDISILSAASTTELNSILTEMYECLSAVKYRPYSVQVGCLPWVEPMDSIVIVDNFDNQLSTIVTNTNYTLNGGMTIAAKGEAAQNEKLAANTVLSAQEKKILSDMRAELTEREKEVINLNTLLGNSLGLHVITDEQDDGSVKYYFCNQSTLASSTMIYTFNANGFAWTTKWNNGNPTWQYGFTSTGNAVLNMISVHKLSANWIKAGVLSGTGNNTTSFNLDTGSLVMRQGAIYIGNKFSVDTYGNLTASGADIRGTILSGNPDGYWTKLDSDGKLIGGLSSAKYGYIDYSMSMDTESGTYYGVRIVGGAIRFDAGRISVYDRLTWDGYYDESDSGASTATGSGTITVTTNMTRQSASEYTWKTKTLRFIHGLMVTQL